MTTRNVNIDNFDRQFQTLPDTAVEMGNNLLERAQEAQRQQATLLDSTPLESRYNGALAVYVEAKYEQVERIEDSLENLIEQQMATLQDYQVHRPAGLLLRPRAREAWEREQARRQTVIQRLESRLERVREIKEEMGLNGTKIEQLAARKLRLKEPGLAGEWDIMRTAQRNHEAIERQKKAQQRSQPLIRVRSLNMVLSDQ